MNDDPKRVFDKTILTTEIEVIAEFIILLFHFDSVIARQGLVCSDPESFLQDQNKTNKNSLCGLSVLSPVDRRDGR